MEGWRPERHTAAAEASQVLPFSTTINLEPRDDTWAELVMPSTTPSSTCNTVEKRHASAAQCDHNGCSRPNGSGPVGMNIPFSAIPMHKMDCRQMEMLDCRQMEMERNLAQQLRAAKPQQLRAAKPQQLHCGQRNHSNCNAHTVTADMEFLPGALHLTHAREDMPGAMQNDTVGLNTVRLKNVLSMTKQDGILARQNSSCPAQDHFNMQHG
jgi:hypothetical protein